MDTPGNYYINTLGWCVGSDLVSQKFLLKLPRSLGNKPTRISEEIESQTDQATLRSTEILIQRFNMIQDTTSI